MKFGYRLVDRYPSPFTNTDTRSTLTFNRNFTNNPVNNAGGTGLATLLTGYMTAAARGFLLEPYDLRMQEHGLFVQDDFKMSQPPHRQRRPALRDLHGADRGGEPPRQLRSREPAA